MTRRGAVSSSGRTLPRAVTVFPIEMHKCVVPTDPLARRDSRSKIMSIPRTRHCKRRAGITFLLGPFACRRRAYLPLTDVRTKLVPLLHPHWREGGEKLQSLRAGASPSPAWDKGCQHSQLYTRVQHHCCDQSACTAAVTSSLSTPVSL